MHIKKKNWSVNFPSNFIEAVFTFFTQNEYFIILNCLFQEKDKWKILFDYLTVQKMNINFLDIQADQKNYKQQM